MSGVRPATVADLPAVFLLAGQTPSAPQWSDAVWRGTLALDPDSTPLRRVLLVHEADELVTGFAVACALPAAAEGELESIAVVPGCRRQGVATALLAAVLHWAQAQGADRLRLEVRAGNHAALRLYDRSGFTASGRRAGYYTAPDEDAVLLERSIECGYR